MNLKDFAKQELYLTGMFDEDSVYGGMIGKAVMELIEVFSNQGHSGYSADIVSELFHKLSIFKPIALLTGNDDEWFLCAGADLYQNKRNSAVFKDGKNGRAYYINAYAKRLPNGTTWQGSLSLKDGKSVVKCYIKDFSNMPTIVIDVLDDEIVKDESQLDELAKYYDLEIEG